MNAIDTNVLVYAVDSLEPDKQSRAVECLSNLANASTPVILPWQVAAEYLACLRRWESLKRVTREQTTAYLAQLEAAYEIVFPTTAVLGRSLELSSRFSLSHWDRMLVAACVEAGVAMLYSEDLTANATYGSVKVINPFEP